jgi:predicted transcriptional regulator
MNKMSKSTTYSWRLSTDLKARLEAAAREEKADVAAILERVVREWLAQRPRQLTPEENAEEQRRLREQLMKAAGTVSSGLGSATNAEVRKVMGEILEKKHRASQRRAPRRPR